METIYRITDNTNQVYNIEFTNVELAKKWIYTHLNMKDILSMGIKPIRKGK